MAAPALVVGVCLVDAFAVGATAALQAGVNRTIGDYLKHAMFGTFTSFVGAMILLFFINVAATGYRIQYRAERQKLSSVESTTEATEDSSATASADSQSENRKDADDDALFFRRPLAWYEYTGGLLGSFQVAAAVFISPIVGFALYFVGLVLGQLFSAALVDHYAFLGLPRRPFSVLRGLAAGLAVVGVALASSEAIGDADSDAVGGMVGGLLVAVLAGAGLPVQSAINRSAAQALRGPEQGATLSFTVGLIASGIGSLVVGLAAQEPDVAGAVEDAPWWAWIGGSAGVFFVVSAIVLPSFISVSSMFLAIVTGNVTVSVVLDAVGAFGNEAQDPSAMRIVGCCLVLAGAFLGEYARMHAGEEEKGGEEQEEEGIRGGEHGGGQRHAYAYGGEAQKLVGVDGEGDDGGLTECEEVKDGVHDARATGSGSAGAPPAQDLPRSPLLAAGGAAAPPAVELVPVPAEQGQGAGTVEYRDATHASA